MPKRNAPTATVAQMMTATTTESLAHVLRHEGMEAAQQRWRELNDTYCVEDWWPQVARAVRRLFDDYALRRQQDEEKRGRADEALLRALTRGTTVSNNFYDPYITMQEPYIDGPLYEIKDNDNINIGK